MYPKALDIYPKPLDRDFPAGKIIFVGCRGNFSHLGTIRGKGNGEWMEGK